MVQGLPCLLSIEAGFHVADMRAARVRTEAHVMNQCARVSEAETCVS